MTKTTAPITVQLRPLPQTDEFQRVWAALEQDSVEGNAFMSPHFVLPALRHLTPDARLLAMMAYRGDTLVGLGLFEPRAASRRLPMPHLQAYRCEHSYASGFLLRNGEAAQAANAMFAWLHKWRRVWGAVEFLLRPGDGPVHAAMIAAAERARMRWIPYATFERAAVRPAEAADSVLREHWSKNHRKKMRRAERTLATAGEVAYRTVWPADANDDAAVRFLELEAMGWKGDEGSAMAASPARLGFYNAMVDGFASRGDAYFSQLFAGDAVVATSVNLVSANVGFGFKIGWHTDHAEASPGTLHEHKYIETAQDHLGRLRWVDATSDAESFVNRVWPHSRTITSGVFATGRASSIAIHGLLKAKQLVEQSRQAA